MRSVWLFLWCIVTVSTAHAQVVPLKQAHAHNDYEHARPLLDALDHGFCSVEADIWLTKDGLLVAHTFLGLKPEKTLQKLYLDPLKERVKKYQGSVYQQTVPFYLLIDIKTDAKTTYAALAKVLAEYGDMLTVTHDGKTERRAITVVISGNVDRVGISAEKTRYAAIDGRPSDLTSTEPAHLIPWISTSWSSQFKWKGIGPMPEAERQKLQEYVKQAHAAGRKVRFWATPDQPNAWQEQLTAQVDLINTDQLHDLKAFLLKSQSPVLLGGGPYVIAHRGGTGPDSTLAGIEKSLKQGYQFIELDVRVSRDGKVVVIHDATVDRTTNGKGNVADLTFEQLRALDAGGKYQDPSEPKKSFAGERIPTPDEVLLRVGNRGIVLFELKVPAAADELIRSIKACKAEHRAVVRTADIALLKKLKERDPQIVTGAMAAIPEDGPTALINQLKTAKVATLTPKTNVGITADIVKQFHDAGIAFWGTNTNDAAEMRALLTAKVAGIITDSPAMLAELIKK